MIFSSTWQKWLKEKQQAQAAFESAKAGVWPAQHALERAQDKLNDRVREAAPAGAKVNNPPTLEQVADQLSRLDAMMNKDGSLNHAQRRAEWAGQASAIKQAQAEHGNATEALKQAQHEQQQAEQALQDMERAMPSATPKAVAAIEAEIEDRRQKIGKVDATLAAMKDSSSIAAELESTAKAAAEDVERLEAQALLGNADETAKGNAATALTKARKESEKAAEQTEKQKAAKRGLEKMRHDWEAELESLQTLLNGVGFEVTIAEAAKHEQTLLAALESIGLDRLLANINRARDQATAYADGKASYSTARMRVKLPILYEVSAPDDIEY